MRRSERQVTDPEIIKEILDKCKIVHLGLVDDGKPYVVPLSYGYTFDNNEITLYLHGAKEGRKLNIIKKNPLCCFEMECDVVPIPGKVPCSYGTAYSSIIGNGVAEIIEDSKEKEKALTTLMKTQTGKDFEINENMAKSVTVIRIKSVDFTAKRREIPKE